MNTMTETTDPDEQKPVFENVQQMCRAFGWSDKQRAQIEDDMAASAPRGSDQVPDSPDRVLH